MLFGASNKFLHLQKYLILSILITTLVSSFVLPNLANASITDVCHKQGPGNYKYFDNTGGGHSGHASDFIGGLDCTVPVDTSNPSSNITYSVPGPYKSGTVVRIHSVWNENVITLSSTISISGSNSLSTNTMTLNVNDPNGRSFYYDYTVGAGDGTATVTVSATDPSDNTGVSTNTFIVDNTAPTTTASVASGSYNTNQSVTLSANEASTIYYTTNGANPTVSSTQYSGAITISSTTTLKYFARDTAGNSESIQSRTYTIDTTAPTTTASVASGSYNTNQSVTLSANEASTIYYTTNGANPTVSSTQYSGAITISSTTTLKYFARDTAGNSESIQSRTYTIDTTAPTVTLTTTAPNPTNTAFTVTATFSESVTGLGLDDISVTNGVDSNLSGSGAIYTFTVTPASNPVSVQIQANSVQDLATNTNTASSVLSQGYTDVATIPSAPTGLTVTGDDLHASLSWVAPNNGGSALTDYILRICQTTCDNDANWSIFNDGVLNSTSGVITNLTGGGQYTFKVSAVNGVGRGINSTSQTITLPSAAGMKIIPGNGQVKLQFDVSSSNRAWTDVKILKFNHESNAYVTLYDFGSDRSSLVTLSGTSREIVITGLANDVKYSLKVIPNTNIGNGATTNNVVVIPTANTSNLISSNSLKFYEPPTISSSNLNKLQTFGLTDLTIPSPGLITLNQMNSFDPGINQKILVNTSITKDTTMNTVLNTYGVPTYTAPSDWNSTNVFTVPPVIIPVTSSGSTIGQQSVYSVETVSPQKPIFLALNDADKISSIKGKIEGVSFTLNATATANKFNMTSTYTTTPPTGVAQVSDALMYMNFNTATTSGVNFGKSSSFDSAPSVSFTLGPQSGSTSSSNPTNTVNSAITCPQPIVSSIADDGTVSATGITVSRDTSGDDSTSCGYTATLQHFSSYAVTASIPSSSTGTGNSIELPPQLINDPYVLRIANSKYKINELSSLSPAVFPVGIPIEIEILLKDSKGSENISHVELFLNKHDGKVLNDLSETMIIYDRLNGNGILDRNYLVDSYTIIPTMKNGNASFLFKIIFKNQMKESDLVFRIWDLNRNGLNLHVPNALEIISSSQQIEICHIPPQTNQNPETISISKSELQLHLSHGDTSGKCLEKSALKEWVRYYIELWQFGIIDDQTFKEGFNHLIDQRIIEIDQNENEEQATFTNDFKKNAMDWYQKNITNDDFLSLITKLMP